MSFSLFTCATIHSKWRQWHFVKVKIELKNWSCEILAKTVLKSFLIFLERRWQQIIDISSKHTNTDIFEANATNDGELTNDGESFG